MTGYGIDLYLNLNEIESLMSNFIIISFFFLNLSVNTFGFIY